MALTPPQTRGACGGSHTRRQPSCGGTSRMTRECQVPICERLGSEIPRQRAGAGTGKYLFGVIGRWASFVDSVYARAHQGRGAVSVLGSRPFSSAAAQ